MLTWLSSWLPLLKHGPFLCHKRESYKRTWFFKNFIVHIAGLKTHLSSMLVQWIPSPMFWLLTLQERRSPYNRHNRQDAEWQGSLWEKYHLMALVVRMMSHRWRTQSPDSYPWVISMCLKQLVLSFRHLSTCADDVLTSYIQSGKAE